MTAPNSEAMQKLACNSDAASPSGLGPFAADARVLNTGLTRDNTFLSRATMAPFQDERALLGDRVGSNQLQIAATNDADQQTESMPAIDVSGPVRDLIANSIADNTRRAYKSDVEHFLAWGGAFPASPTSIASYLAEYGKTLKAATLVRRVAAIAKAHEAKGLPSPTTSVIVKGTMRGIKRTYGTSQRQSKPLLREDLFLILDKMKERPKDVRDRALLILGFGGGFRRSELVGLNCADIETVREGLIVTLRRSKTDQELAGRKIGIPYGRTRHCPVSALEVT